MLILSSLHRLGLFSLAHSVFRSSLNSTNLQNISTRLCYVPLPSPSDRASILRTVVRKAGTPLAEGALRAAEALAADVQRCRGYSGADIAALVREASMEALREDAASASTSTSGNKCKVLVSSHHFEAAMEKVVPSVSPADEAAYASLKQRLRQRRGVS